MTFKLLIFTFLSINLYAEILISKQTTQLLVVSSDSFTNKTATLQAYERDKNSWKKHLKSITVNLGRNGLAWGKGLITFQHKPEEPIKKEGDGKAPAGLFELESLFGYEDNHFSLPYLKVNSSSLCIDDSTSKDYNTILQNKDTTTYKSFEYMKRKDNLYKLGVVVGHNQKAIKEHGSCIFLHIQKKKNSATAGCTSMQEENLLTIMKWLKQSEHPLLLQLPVKYLKEGFR